MKKSLISLFAVLTVICISLVTVNAAGNVPATFTGNDSVNIDDTFTLNLSIDSVEGSADGKLYAFGGYVDYDPEYLQYVSFSGASGWTGTANAKSRLKISTVDFSLNQGVTSGNIGTITFKALKAGKTTVTMSTIEATDQEKNLDAVFTPKEITIVNPNNPLSSDSSLKSLDVSGYTLTPAFSSNTTSYEMNVPNNVTGLDVTAIANDEHATVNTTGNSNWVVGENTIEITVTAEDNSQTVYTITVNRAAPILSNNTNVNLNITTQHLISPSFSNSVDDYNVTIENEITNLNMEVTPEDEHATVNVNNNENLADGSVIESVVTAEDGTIRIINLNIIKDSLPNANLSDLRIDGTTIANFNKDTLTYNLDYVTNDKESINIEAIPEDEHATVSGDGVQILTFGNNSFDITVTDSGNQTTKTYTINVPKLMKGDISFDGRVTLLDIRLMLQKMLNNDYNDQEKWVIDYNDDNKVTLMDIRLCLQWYLNH